MNFNINVAGFCIAALFVLVWVAALAYWGNRDAAGSERYRFPTLVRRLLQLSSYCHHPLKALGARRGFVQGVSASCLPGRALPHPR